MSALTKSTIVLRRSGLKNSQHANRNQSKPQPKRIVSVRCEAVDEPVPVTVAAEAAKVKPVPESFLDSMKFSGFAPEIINGRVAQVAFMAGLGAEISTGESFPQQFHDHPFALALAAGLVTMASFMPSIQGSTEYTSNPNSLPGQNEATFNPDAEKLNGRTAMMGLMGILVVESLKG